MILSYPAKASFQLRIANSNLLSTAPAHTGQVHVENPPSSRHETNEGSHIAFS
jgi:hypothetical protein